MTIPSATAWGSRWRWVPRRLWIAVLTTVIAVAVAVAFAGAHPHSYSSKSVVMVTTGASGAGPGSANEAATLAITYAGLIPQDGGFVHALGSALGLPAADVAKNLKVSVESTTALMDISFTASSPSLAIAGARDAAAMLTGAHPAAAAIPSGSMQVVTLAVSATEGGMSANRAGAIGAVLGIAFGAVLIVTWEHLDARVDRTEDLAGIVVFPVWDTRMLSGEMWDALAARCRSTAGEGARLALVPTPGAEQTAHSVAGYLPAPTEVVPAAAAPTGPAEPVILVVPAGCPVKVVTGFTDTLEQLGVLPVWGLVAPAARRRFRRSPQRAAAGWQPPVLAPVGRRATRLSPSPNPVVRNQAERRP